MIPTLINRIFALYDQKNPLLPLPPSNHPPQPPPLSEPAGCKTLHACRQSHSYVHVCWLHLSSPLGLAAEIYRHQAINSTAGHHPMGIPDGNSPVLHPPGPHLRPHRRTRQHPRLSARVGGLEDFFEIQYLMRDAGLYAVASAKA